jgi:hypothetical protein
LFLYVVHHLVELVDGNVELRGILGEWAEEMVALEETETLLGGSSHHYDTSNLPACCAHTGASSGVLCALVGETAGRCGDGARMLLAQQWISA